MCQPLLLFLIHIIGYAQGQFGEPNIALRKPAYQYPGDFCYAGICYGAERAVDGELDPPYDVAGHCTHTSIPFVGNAFWTVNFTRFYQISGIVVHNIINTPAIGSRLREFSVYGIGTEQMTGDLLYKYNYTFTSNSYDPVIKITLPSIPYVSGIRIEIPRRTSGTDTILTLCEVKVFSDLVCPNLTLNSFTVATYTNYTNHESIASFNCTEGYKLNETFPLVCKGWQWDRQPPACELIYCPFPPELRYGNYTVLDSCSQKQDTHLPFNCLIEANCRTGYNLTQGETRRCLSSQQWSTPNSICDLVKCSLPNILHGNSSLKNGSVVYDDRIDYGTEIYVTCDIGYNITSAHTRICQQDGTLSGAESECIVVMCDHPGNIANGSYTDISNNLYSSGHMNYSDIIYVNCDTGYIIKSGLGTRKCQYTGKWSDLEPECTLVTCPPLEKISNLVYTYSDQTASAGYVYGSSVNVSCETGMIQQGSNTRRCTAEGTWDGIPSTCKTDSSKPLYLIGVVIGSVIGLVIIIVAVLLILKRRKKNTMSTNEQAKPDSSTPTTRQESDSAADQYVAIYDEIHTDDLKMTGGKRETFISHNELLRINVYNEIPELTVCSQNSYEETVPNKADNAHVYSQLSPSDNTYEAVRNKESNENPYSRICHKEAVDRFGSSHVSIKDSVDERRYLGTVLTAVILSKKS